MVGNFHQVSSTSIATMKGVIAIPFPRKITIDRIFIESIKTFNGRIS